VSKFPQLRILHLSDFHFDTPTDVTQSDHICDHPDRSASPHGLHSLFELIRKDLESSDWERFGWTVGTAAVKPPRIIVAATGDFAHTATPSEFDKASDLLSRLTSSGPVFGSAISSKDIFIVPGNHDVLLVR
jgi:3',5'-cyclic AMP phosphodiesterase CpdA